MITNDNNNTRHHPASARDPGPEEDDLGGDAGPGQH